MFSGLIAAGWALVLPYVGPVLAWFALRGWSLPAFATVARWARVASYVALLGCGVWVGVAVNQWWEGDKLTQKQAKEKAAAAIAEANLEARRQALDALQAHLADQARTLERDAIELANLERELNDARANSEDGRRVVFSGADEWLRKWMARGR
jgi:uncharacterized membrane protein YcjF (UPF0283 family)